MRLTPLLALALPLLAGCTLLGQGTVTRKVHGRLEEGRFVSDTAYLAYTEGALAESRRELDVAERAYLQAASLDDDSADVWGRVGAVRCAAGDRARAEEAFSRAKRIDPEWAPLFAERATCLLSAGDLTHAREEAAHALALDPTRETTTLLIAKIELRAGHPDEARRWLRGLLARSPWRVDLRSAEAAGGGETPTYVKRDDAPPKAARAELDQALGRGDRREAGRLAVAAHVSTGGIALRAAALGLWQLAREHGALVLDADPSNTEARVALLVAGDALDDPASRARALLDLPRRSDRISEMSALLLGELLQRHGFEDGARAVRERATREDAEDPLLAKLRDRARAPSQ